MPALILAGLSAASPAEPGRSIQSIAIPPSGDYGVDMAVVDPEAMPQEPELARNVPKVADEGWDASPVDLLKPIHPLYTELRRQLIRYRMKWGALPQLRIPTDGGTMRLGASDPRIPLLRQRLGLPETGSFDAALKSALGAYQTAHGLKADGIAGAGTLASLNRGAAYYEALILINMERARRLPAPGTIDRYVVVDAGSARLWMYENGKAVGSMRVIVGKAGTPTPMMAALMRYVSLNPYWNVPPELARDLVAKKVVAEGLGYLKDRDYEVLSDWSDDATLVDPATVDWQAVADGKVELPLRRRPGPWNSMGQIKFMLPNEYGIYLHDVPDKSHFADDDRWISNGCVRLEDYRKLAKWIFGKVPTPKTAEPDEKVDLAAPMPVYFTYFTVEATPAGPLFRKDPYGRDPALLARLGAAGDQTKDVSSASALSGTGDGEHGSTASAPPPPGRGT